MRKKQVSLQAELPLEQRIRVADFLLLLITIDRRLTLQAKASKAAKASQPKHKATTGTAADTAKARDKGSRSPRALFIYFFKALTLISKPTACKTVLSELKRGFPALESILYRFCLLRSVFSAK